MQALKNINTSQIKIIQVAIVLMFTAIMLGAFGAHGLEGKISTKALKTFKTGNFYQFIQTISIFVVILIEVIFNKKFKKFFLFNFIGLAFFCLNCYLYAFSALKIFALLVPIGGVCFLLAWLTFFLDFRSFAANLD